MKVRRMTEELHVAEEWEKELVRRLKTTEENVKPPLLKIAESFEKSNEVEDSFLEAAIKEEREALSGKQDIELSRLTTDQTTHRQAVRASHAKRRAEEVERQKARRTAQLEEQEAQRQRLADLSASEQDLSARERAQLEEVETAMRSAQKQLETRGEVQKEQLAAQPPRRARTRPASSALLPAPARRAIIVSVTDAVEAKDSAMLTLGREEEHGANDRRRR